MKKIIILSLILCGISSAYTQNITQEMYDGKVVENADLTNQIKLEQDKNSLLSSAYKKDTLALQKQIKALHNELSTLKKIKDDWKNLEEQLKTKDNSINLLNQQLITKEQEFFNEMKNGEHKARNEKENGKNEALAYIINNYKYKQFDELIESSTKQSIQRDIQIVGNNIEIKQILSEMLSYFNSTELLTKKFEVAQINKALEQLDQIIQKSMFLEKLKENMKYYQNYNNKLKETIEKIVILDTHPTQRTFAGDDINIQELKYSKIISELANYIYHYEDYGNYPYLSDIILDVIKRKRPPNADADISDLLKKL